MTKRLTPMFEDPGESAQLRELLETGRSARVADYDFEQGLRRHLAQVEAGVPAPQWAQSLGAGGSSAAGGALSHSLWLWIGVPVLSVATIAAMLWGSSNGSAPAPAAVAALPAPVAPAAVEPSPAAPALKATSDSSAHVAEQRAPRAVEPLRQGPRVRAAAPRAAAKHGVAARSPEVTAAAAPSGTRPALGSSDTPSRSTPAALATKAAPSARNAAEKVAVEPEVAAPEPQPEARPAAAKPEAPQLDDSRLEREMGMLAMTQRVLFADPARALNLARQGESEFEGSMFTQERQQLLLLALVKLGRLDEAKRLARPYLARYPKGPFSDRVRRSLASGRVDR